MKPPPPDHAAPALRLAWRLLLAAGLVAALAAGLITTLLSVAA
ncbi:hypothetical protein [Dactylosporangium sp. CA-233914]